MNKKSPEPKARAVKIKCSICGKSFITKIFPDRTYTGGHCFGKIGDKGKNLEYWECDKCYKE